MKNIKPLIDKPFSGRAPLLASGMFLFVGVVFFVIFTLISFETDRKVRQAEMLLKIETDITNMIYQLLGYGRAFAAYSTTTNTPTMDGLAAISNAPPSFINTQVDTIHKLFVVHNENGACTLDRYVISETINEMFENRFVNLLNCKYLKDEYNNLAPFVAPVCRVDSSNWLPICIPVNRQVLSDEIITDGNTATMQSGFVVLLFSYKYFADTLRAFEEQNGVKISIRDKSDEEYEIFGDIKLFKNESAKEENFSVQSSQRSDDYDDWNIAIYYKGSYVKTLKDTWYVMLVVLVLSVAVYLMTHHYFKLQYKHDRRFRMVVENSTDTLIILDSSTAVVKYADDKIYEVCGYKPYELYGRSFFDIHADVTDSMSEFIFLQDRDISDTAFANNHFRTETRLVCKNGTNVWVELSASFVDDGNGNYNEIYGMLHCIDERKANEERVIEQREELVSQQEVLLEQREELLSQQDILIKQREALEESNSTKNRFFSIIAHDLRNPFGALNNMAELVDERIDTMTVQEFRKIFGTIISTTKHIGSLLENLLQWSRANMGSIEFNPESLNLLNLLNIIFDDLEAQISAKNIHLKLVPKIESAQVVCDANMIRTVVRNLISNAVKFSNEGKSIRVIVSDFRDFEHLLVTVQDEGVGIPKDKIAKLFSVGENITTKGTRGENGTGLGLVLCKEFIQKHKCKIWVESVVGKGTEFKFTLPMMK
ncbi:MAG: PAS domain-containing sensor histidine kinase [Ignavibacteria bacterium]|jgi:PAS domain S-box-containing protein|nr:PAS domain-containing sensor histidine kinase [Ignavibacteria bacterium]